MYIMPSADPTKTASNAANSNTETNTRGGVFRNVVGLSSVTAVVLIFACIHITVDMYLDLYDSGTQR